MKDMEANCAAHELAHQRRLPTAGGHRRRIAGRYRVSIRSHERFRRTRGRGCRVSTVIVVANQTLGTPALKQSLEALGTQETIIHFLVPIKEEGDLTMSGPPRAGAATRSG